mmetsp:Transcript_13252/g.15790  ORF Transcript_13252/g.15790 Transcript_13252/m.15790 type:complete len:514 (+) Transcript_13252:197-1738(+)
MYAIIIIIFIVSVLSFFINKILHIYVSAFIQVIVTEAEFCDIQRCFQEMLNVCAIIEDQCTNLSSETEIEIENKGMNSSACEDQVHLPIQGNTVVQEQLNNVDVDPDALHCLQRQILGLDTDYDREHLDKTGLSEYVKNTNQTTTGQRTDNSGKNKRIDNNVNDSDTNPIRLWSKIIANARQFGIQSTSGSGGGQSSHILGTENDDADMVGEMGHYLTEVMGSIEKQQDRYRAMRNAKRLPAFARKDAIVAIRTHLEELNAKGLSCLENLTRLLQLGVLTLLDENGMILVCDTLESLAIAWQCQQSNDSNNANNANALVEEARCLVNGACSTIQANSRKRRVALAAANILNPLNASSSSLVFDSIEQGSMMTDSNKKFDPYARNPSRKVGFAAREIGRERKRNEEGSIHLSRHCSYEPSFNDLANLSVGSSQVKINNSSSSNGSNGSKLNTSSTFRAPEKKWKLDTSCNETTTTHQTRHHRIKTLPPPSRYDISGDGRKQKAPQVSMVSPQLF